MCIDKDTLFKIIEITISASVPFVIFILGVKITRKLEDVKNESTKKLFWQNKWREVFFEKYKLYIKEFSVLLADLELLMQHIRNETQNNSAGTTLQNEINESSIKIFKLGVELKIHAISLFGENDEIIRTIDNAYRLLVSLINNRVGNPYVIFEELKKLNKITGEKFDSNLKNE